MKITAFDEAYPARLATGDTWLDFSAGSNTAEGNISGAGDVVGDPGDYTVVGLRRVVSLASNMGGSTIGDVLTIIQANPRLATFATPSNTGGAAFGSNSTRVSETVSVGFSSNTSRADHLHDGIGTITASSSNTMQRGTFNLRAGTNVAFGLTDTDGDGEFDTLTIGASAAGGGGGGGITHAYVGYDTVGGSWESLTALRVYAKKVTLAAACVMTDIEAYVQMTNTGSVVGGGLVYLLFDDAAGSPDKIIHRSDTGRADSLLMDSINGAGGVSRPRWLGGSVGRYLAAGDYWIACVSLDVGDGLQMAYDGSGADRYYNTAGTWYTDWGFYTPTTTTNKYSLRAGTIS